MPLSENTTVYLLIHLLKENFGCLQLLAIINETTINISVQGFVWMSVFNLFEYMLVSVTAGSYG